MYPTNNEAAFQQTGVENATQGSGNRYCLTESNMGHLVDPQYTSVSPPTWLHSQPTIAEPNWAQMGNSGDQAIQNAMPEWPGEPTGNIPPMNLVAILQQLLEFDERQAKDTANRIQTGLALREELHRSSGHVVYKRLREPEPDPGAGTSQWMAECEGPGGADSPNTRHAKRRKVTTEEGGTGDRAAAQRGKTQELHVRRTPAMKDDKSKLGRGLEETPSVPSQGVYPPISPGPTVTGAALGLLNDQAWTRGEERISKEAGDEDEGTDGDVCERLMYREEMEWRCRGCNGKGFYDRSTLSRHCKTVHGNARLWCPHPYCTKSYKRQSGLNRHIREKHSEVGGHS